jgi:translocation and assembly module TamA
MNVKTRLSLLSPLAIPRLAGAVLLALSITIAPLPAAAIWPFGNGGVEYNVLLDGAEEELAAWLRAVSLLENKPDPAPQNAMELESLAGADVTRLRDALKAKGYYDAQVRMEMQRPENGEKEPLRVIFHLTPGKMYHFTDARIDWQGEYHYPVDNLQDLAPKAGNPAEADKMQATADAIGKQVGNEFCLLSLDVVPAVELDRQALTAQPVYQITAGLPALFGDVEVSGEKRATKELVKRQSKIKPGSCYQQEKVAAGKRALLSTQLYGQADIAPASQTPAADGSVPMQVKVTERKPRTVRVGASYSTDEGPGTRIRWEHRNLNGDALKATSDFTISQRLQGVNLTAYQPDFWGREKQTLALNTQLQQELTDAYDARTMSLGANIERQLIPHLTAGFGGGYRLSDVKRTGSQETYGLVFVPTFVQWDNRDDAMNATRGLFARASLAPYVDTLGQDVQFLRAQITTQGYFTANNWPLQPTLALRGVVGMIEGASPDNVPADLRFYAGGGGSVRGYGFQSIGPQDASGDPIGGNSWLEFSTELRLKFTDDLGMVAFLDGGSVQPDSTGFGTDILFGAGLGLRYYTAVGPLRFDVGLPLNKRDGVDDSYQLYVSLGQAF